MGTDDSGDPNVKLYLLLQSDRFIHNVEPPYQMQSLLKVKNCIYARYTGPTECIKFACDKIGIYAFENHMEVDGRSYIIYISENEEDETMIADVFMPIIE